VRARPLLVAVAVAVAVALPAGCSSGGAGGTLTLAWQFADGRDCLNAGADHVELRLAPPATNDTPLSSFPCALGLAPATVTTRMLPGAGTLYLDARSTPGSDLYRGTLALDSAPFSGGAAATVILYAAAAN
jgi:hypothetical protein